MKYCTRKVTQTHVSFGTHSIEEPRAINEKGPQAIKRNKI